MERRVYVSMTFDDHLTPEQNNVKWAIVDQYIAAGLFPHFFFPHVPEKYEGKVMPNRPGVRRC